MRTASVLGTLVQLLKVGSGVPVLGGGMCVCTDQSAMQLVTTVPVPAVCWTGKGHFWGEGRVPDLQELTNSLQSTKKTRQGQETSPMMHTTNTPSKGTHLKQTATPKACLFVFFLTGQVLTLNVHLYCLDPSGKAWVQPHMKDVWHCTMCIFKNTTVRSTSHFKTTSVKRRHFYLLEVKKIEPKYVKNKH